MNEIYFYSVQIGFFQWEKLSPLVPENSLEFKQHRREILSMPQWFDFALTLTKGWWHLIRDGHQYSPAQNTLAHRSKKQTTAPLSRGSKFLGDFITDFPRADKFERRHHATCTSPIMHLINPPHPPPPGICPQILHKHCFQFLLRGCNTQEKWQTNVMQNFGGQIRCIMGDVQVAYAKRLWVSYLNGV